MKRKYVVGSARGRRSVAPAGGRESGNSSKIENLERRLMLATYEVALGIMEPYESLLNHAPPVTASGAPGESDQFTFEPIYSGSTASVVITPIDPTLRLSASLEGVSSTAAAAGEPLILQNVPVGLGVRQVEVQTLEGSGDYTVRVHGNSQMEAEAAGAFQNDTPATAESIDGSAMSMAGGKRLAVTGNASPGSIDLYSFTAVANRPMSLALIGAVGTMEVLDASGAVVFQGATGAESVREFTKLFRAPADGQYYVRISGTGTGEYSLIITDGLNFGLERDETAGALQQLLPSTSMLGYVSAGIPFVNIESSEPNDTLNNYVDLGVDGDFAQGVGYVDTLGDVDMLYLGNFQEGDTLEIDIDLPNGGDSVIRLFNANGDEWDYNDDGYAPDDYDDNGIPLPNEDYASYLFIDYFGGNFSGDFWIGVSDVDNYWYDAWGGDTYDHGGSFDYNIYVSVNGATPGPPSDTYELRVLPNETLTLTASSLTGLLTADLTLALFDENNQLLAFADDGEGTTDPTLVYHVPAEVAPGARYTVQLNSTLGDAPYLLRAEGNFAFTGPEVTQIFAENPHFKPHRHNAGQYPSFPAEVRVTTSDALLADSIDSVELEVVRPGGEVVSAAVSRVEAGNVLVFDTRGLADGAGDYTFRLQPAALTGASGALSFNFKSTTINFTDETPRVVTSSIGDGDLISSAGDLNYVATFNTQLLNQIGGGSTSMFHLTGEDISLLETLSGAYFDAAWGSYDEPDGTPTFEALFNGISEGIFELRLLADRTPGFVNFYSDEGFQSLNEVPLDGGPGFPLPSGDGTAGDDFVVGFTIDRDGVAVMPALVSLEPLQSRIATSSIGGAITHTGDVDRFSIDLHPGSPMDIRLEALGGGAQFRVTIYNPDGSVRDTVMATGADGNIVIPFQAYEGGVYEIEVESVEGIGSYRIDAISGALGGSTGDTPATAYDLAPTQLLFGNGSGRYGAVGEVLSEGYEVVRELQGDFNAHEPRYLEFPAGPDPVGDVIFEFVHSSSWSSSHYNITVSFEDTQSRTVFASSNSNNRFITISRDDWMRMAADGVVRIGVQANDNVGTGKSLTVTQRYEIPAATDLYRLPVEAGVELSALVHSLDNDPLVLRFEDADGNILAGGERMNPQQWRSLYTGTGDGEVYLRVLGSGRYTLAVGRDATMRHSPANQWPLETTLGPSNKAVSDLRPFSSYQDYFFFARAGDVVTLETFTPGTSEGNTLDTYLDVWSVSGTYLGGSGTGGEGLNAKLTVTITEDGYQKTRIRRISGGGPVLLSIDGASADNVPPQVSTTFPLDGTESQGRGLILRFNEPIIATDALLAGLSVDGGVTVTGAEVVDGRTIRFLLSGADSASVYSYTLAAGVVRDATGNGNVAYSGSFEVDGDGPRLVGMDPAQAAPPMKVMTLVFDDLLDAATVSKSDILSVTGPNGDLTSRVWKVEVDGVRLRVFLFDDQTTNGDYTVVLKPNFNNLSGFAADQDADGIGGEASDDLITATVTIANANLAVTSVTAPGTLRHGEAFDITWVVENQGTDPADSPWWDRVYLSTDATFNTRDRYLGQFQQTDLPLAPGESRQRTQSLTLPYDLNLTTGEYYLFVVADFFDGYVEEDEADNIASTTVTLEAPDLPDMVVSEISGPATAISGTTVEYTYTLTNAGTVDFTGEFFERLYFSADAAAGNDRYLKQVLFSGTLTAGSSVQRTVEVDIPLDVEGQQWLVVTTDYNDAVEELFNELNNTTVADAPTDVTLAPQVDLIIESITAPASALSGERISITWVLRNNGSGHFSGTFSDRVWLSSDQTPGSDFHAGTFAFTGEIAAGQSVERTVEIALPIDMEGQRWVIVRTDVNNQVPEIGGEENNISVSSDPIDIELSDQPNLVVSSVVAPSTIFSGQTATIDWQVDNVGVGPTSAAIWYDYVYLSSDQKFDGGDKYLGSRRNGAYLGAGESYASTLNVTLPIEISGDYYILIRTDARNNQAEVGGEDDNLGVSNVMAVTLSPPPDLQVSFIDAPSNLFSGQGAQIRWTITNEGDGDVRGSWNDAVYLSDDDTFDASDKRLATFGSGTSYLAAGHTQVMEQTVSVPEGISGSKFLIIVTDFNDRIFEGPFENNNRGTQAVNILLTPPPDLVASVQSLPSSSVSGKPITLSYSISNDGSSAPGVGSWYDAFYLSTDEILDASDRYLGNRSIKESGLVPGSSYERTVSLMLPVDVEGNYFILVDADYQHRVFELDRENNIAAAPTLIAGDLPNLAILNEELPDTIYAGKSFIGQVTVGNSGIDHSRVTRWIDRIYLSTDDQFSSDDPLIGSWTHNNELLLAGESYDTSSLYALAPTSTLPGNYFLIFRTDAFDHVYEGDETDNLVVKPVTVVQDLPDLQAEQISFATPVIAGEPVTVNWNIRNHGGDAFVSYWEDALYLSSDPTFDSGDQRLGSGRHHEMIAAGATSTAGVSFTPDISLQGTYYLLLVVDAGNRVFEGSAEFNNLVVEPFEITPGPTPDLVVTQVSAAGSGYAGRLINVTWTTRNDGDKLARSPYGGGGFWETLYLSADPLYDSGDRTLKSFSLGPIEPGVEVHRSASVRLPSGITGDYYILVRTDSGSQVAEVRGELNNVTGDLDGIKIELAPPVDLVAGAIQLPGNAYAGQDATITYEVTNAGPSDVVGSWTDTLFISADPQWDVNDAFFGELSNSRSENSPLVAGDSYSRTITAPLPGLATGNYYVIVRSDILNWVVETNENNNAAASLENFAITIPQLPLGEPTTMDLDAGRFVYYKVSVEAGKTLLVDLDNAGFGATELYIRYGDVATRNEFDVAFERPLDSDQRVIVGDTRAGDYYITAWVARDSQITLHPRLVPFGLIDTDLGVGGDAGNRTIRFVGARFDRSVSATLVGQGVTLEPTAVYPVSPSEFYATYDLTDAPLGKYDAILSKASTGEASTSSGAFSVVDALPTTLRVTGDVSGPGAARVGSTFRVSAAWGNEGTNDIVAPVLFFSVDGTTFGQSLGTAHHSQMLFVGAGTSGAPAGILLPKQGETRTFQLAGAGGGVITSSLSIAGTTPDTPYDWEAIRDSLVVTEWSDEQNQRAFAALVARVGTTWGQFEAALSHSVSRLSDIPEFLLVEEALVPEMFAALAAVSTSISGRIYADSFAVNIADRDVLLVNVVNGTSYAARTFRDGSFHAPDITPGTYRLTVPGALETAPVHVTVAADQAVTNVRVDLIAGSTIRGTVEAGGSGIEAAIGIYDERNILVASGLADVNGTYEIKGLLPGAYHVVAEAEGMARAVEAVTVPTDESIGVANFALEAGSRAWGAIIADAAQLGYRVAAIPLDPIAGGAFTGIVEGVTFSIDHLLPGSYVLRLSKEGYLPLEQPFTVTAGNDLDLGRFDLTAESRISGWAKDELGNPLAQLSVGAYRSGQLIAHAFTGEGGQFTLRGLAAGTYEVRAVSTNLLTSTPTVTVESESAATGVNVVVTPGTTLRGTVVDADGNPVAGQGVVLVEGTRAITQTITNALGEYTFEGLLPQVYSLSLQGSFGQSVRLDIPKGSQTITQPPLVAPTAIGSLSGSVRLADGTLLPFAEVFLLAENGLVANTRADADGVYTFRIHTDGNFHIAAIDARGTFAPVPVTLGEGTLTRNLTAGDATLTVNVSGTPFQASVSLLSADLEGFVVATGFTRNTSSVSFANLAPGTYTVALGDGSRMARGQVTIVPGSNTISLDPIQTGTLTGTIQRSTGEAAVAAVVARNSVTGEVFSTFASDGSFELGGLAPGNYDLTVTTLSEGAFVQNLSVSAGTNTTTGLVTTAPYAGAATGAITDVDGNGIGGAEVLLRDVQGNVPAYATTAIDGSFTLRANPGTYELVVLLNGAAPVVKSVILADGSETNLGDIHTYNVASGKLPISPQAPAEASGDSGGGSNVSLLDAVGNYTYELIRNVMLQLPEFPWVPYNLADTVNVPDECRGECGQLALEVAKARVRAGQEHTKLLMARDTYENAVYIAAFSYSTGIAQTVKASAQLVLAVEGAVASGVLKAGGSLAKMENALLKVGLSSQTRIALQVAVDSVDFVANIWDGINEAIGNIRAATQPTASWLDLLKATQSVLSNVIAAFDTFRDLDGGLAALGKTLKTLADAAPEAGLKVVDDVKAIWLDTLNNARTTLLEDAFDLVDADFLDKFGAVVGLLGPLLDLYGLFTGGLIENLEKDLNDADSAKFRYESQLKAYRKAEQEFNVLNRKLYNCVRKCIDDYNKENPDDPLPLPPLYTTIYRPQDPNDIVGPAGFGESRYVGTQNRLSYRIRFENDPELATAPAQFIRITSPIDDSLDARSFRLGDIGFGDIVIDVPDDVAFYQTRLDLTESHGFYVDVAAGIDLISRQAFWELETIDPLTGQRPEDPMVGLLPVNDDTGRGEGFADYMIRVAAAAQTGDQVEAIAEIVFDNEAPLLTPLWTNLLDAGMPASAVEVLPSQVEANSFTVRWSGADAPGGTGLAAYDIYVSVDGQPFVPWLLNTTSTEAPFVGRSGRSYAFYSVTRDNAGNSERPPLAADATTRTPGAVIRSRHLFYNNSSFDGRTPGSSPIDDAAIDYSKVPLVHGQKATFANYSSYEHGINGLIIDIDDVSGGLNASDFLFRVGNSNDLSSWTTAPVPLSISIRPGAGVDGSDRITIIWADGAIVKSWLEVTILPTLNTGLTEADVFYFGNTIGETGNSGNDANVNITDTLLTRRNQSGFGQVGIDSRYDFDRNGRVDIRDVLLSQSNSSGFDPLILLDLRDGEEAKGGNAPAKYGRLDGSGGMFTSSRSLFGDRRISDGFGVLSVSGDDDDNLPILR